MTTELLVTLVGLGIGLLIAVIVFLLVYPPMRKLLGINSTLAAAGSFYTRTFLIVLLLAVWAAVMGMDLGKPAAAATQPAAPRPPFMQAVWKVADDLEQLLWPMAVILGVYVALLTVVYAAVGRCRDQ
ncbi:MAG: hypothetical protein AMJ81_14685 [Phycisphaerae bacterium SM23_33]|nr:MAG: hypothetical protein AMJ81_14685 [Phycisphaerae bacterium SM23_33]